MSLNSLPLAYALHLLRMASGLLAPIVTLPTAVRYLGIDSVGSYQILVSISSFFLVLGVSGFSTFGQREAAAVRLEPEKFRTKVSQVYISSCLVSICSYFLFLVSCFFYTNHHQPFFVFVLVGLVIPLSAFSGEWVLLSMDKFNFVSIRVIFSNLLSIFLIRNFVDSRDDFIKYCSFLILPPLISVILNLFKIRSFLRLDELNFCEFLNTLRKSFVFLSNALLISVYTNIDSLSLGYVADTYYVGEYSIAKRLASAGTTISTSLGILLLSKLSVSFATNDVRATSRVFDVTRAFLFYFTLPLAFAMCFGSGYFVSVLSGQSFVNAASALSVLAFNVVFVSLSQISINQVLIPLGRDKEALFCVFIGVLVAIISTFGLFSYSVPTVAPFCFLLSEVSVALSGVWMARHVLVQNFYLKQFLGPIIGILFVILGKEFFFSGRDEVSVYYLALFCLQVFVFYYLGIFFYAFMVSAIGRFSKLFQNSVES